MVDSPGLQENLKQKHMGVRGQGARTVDWGAVASRQEPLGAPKCARRGTSRPVGADKDYGHARLVTMKIPVTSNDKF